MDFRFFSLLLRPSGVMSQYVPVSAESLDNVAPGGQLYPHRLTQEDGALMELMYT